MDERGDKGKDRIRNEYVRGSVGGVASMDENRLRWA